MAGSVVEDTVVAVPRAPVTKTSPGCLETVGTHCLRDHRGCALSEGPCQCLSSTFWKFPDLQ